MKVINDADAPSVIERQLKSSQNDLEKIYYTHQGRRIFKWHHYLSVYDQHLSRFRKQESQNIKILEIGVQNGGSLQLWRRFFGSEVTIFGIDIDPKCKEFEEDNCHIRIGDQANAQFLESVVLEMGGVDIVIDDGSHIASHQNASFRTLFPLLSNDGIYICEDLHTSYWEGWEGGLQRPGTFIETVKQIIDEMHGWYTAVSTDFSAMNLKEKIIGIHVYDSVVVVDKGTKTEPFAVTVGQNSFVETEGLQSSMTQSTGSQEFELSKSPLVKSLIDEKQHALTEALNQISVYKAVADAATNRINALEQSRSWKITASLRTVAGFFRSKP